MTIYFKGRDWNEEDEKWIYIIHRDYKDGGANWFIAYNKETKKSFLYFKGGTKKDESAEIVYDLQLLKIGTYIEVSKNFTEELLSKWDVKIT
jgi:hypothetical protein